ncbi:host cell division inhibitor Icd-like protein [Yersinia rochesterensis]|uniref:Host cell division inhibitor Icd-like protein n=2 Tax=Yersinia rochesterensis TaxID=1604335 RepID=A0A8E3ZHY8_9GAMM|nr:host cell division inhibitor Icd-like protein [Yersinia rochesterensis]
MQLGITMQKGQAKRCDKKCIGHKLTAPLAQLIRDARISAHTVLVIPSAILRPLISLAFSQSKSFATWWVCPDLDIPQPIDLCEILQCRKSTPMADTLSRKSSLAEGEIPPLKQNHRVIAQPSGASLAFLRWRRLISPLAAVTRNPAVLSPSTFSCSISSITSCGIRTVVICDFAFFAPVAITGSPYIRCMSVYAEIIIKKGLKCISLMCSVKNIGEIHLEMTRPRSVGALTGPLTTNDRISIEVAMLNHTQTRPKYQYRFLALHRSDRSAVPCRLSVEAFTEKEARQVLSAHFILSLAARLPVSEVSHA